MLIALVLLLAWGFLRGWWKSPFAATPEPQRPLIQSPLADFSFDEFTVESVLAPLPGERRLFPIFASAETLGPQATSMARGVYFMLWDEDAGAPLYLVPVAKRFDATCRAVYLEGRGEFLLSHGWNSRGDSVGNLLPGETAFHSSSDAFYTGLLFVDEETGAIHRERIIKGRFLPTDYSREDGLAAGYDVVLAGKDVVVPALFHPETEAYERLNVRMKPRWESQNDRENPYFTAPGVLAFYHGAKSYLQVWRMEIDLKTRKTLEEAPVAPPPSVHKADVLWIMKRRETRGNYQILEGRFWMDPRTGKHKHTPATIAHEPTFLPGIELVAPTQSFPGTFRTARNLRNNQGKGQQSGATPYSEIRLVDSNALVTTTTLLLHFAGDDHLMIDHGDQYEFEKLETYLQENQVAPEYRKPPKAPKPVNPLDPLASFNMGPGGRP